MGRAHPADLRALTITDVHRGHAQLAATTGCCATALLRWCRAMKVILLALTSILVAAACRSPQGPVLLQSPASGAKTWTSVSLTVAGPEADDGKRESCMEEANTAGIQLTAGAPIVGTLYFLEQDDYLETPGTPNYVFGAMGSNATCKIALAKLTKIDTLVRMSKAEPTDCTPSGSVEGSDSGFFHPGSYDAAVAEAQFKVRALGGNVFVQDATREQGTRVVVNGRGFQCAQ